MNLRKTKSGQSASTMKPPKFNQELQFLLPIFNEEENRMSNVSLPRSDQLADDESENDNCNDIEEPENTSGSSTTASLHPPSLSSFSRHPGNKPKKRFCTPQVTTASVLDKYLKNKEIRRETPSQDSLTAFFMNMADTVKSFPIVDQIKIKGELFKLVHSVEVRLAQEIQTPTSSINYEAHGSQSSSSLYSASPSPNPNYNQQVSQLPQQESEENEGSIANDQFNDQYNPAFINTFLKFRR